MVTCVDEQINFLHDATHILHIVNISIYAQCVGVICVMLRKRRNRDRFRIIEYRTLLEYRI